MGKKIDFLQVIKLQTFGEGLLSYSYILPAQGAEGFPQNPRCFQGAMNLIYIFIRRFKSVLCRGLICEGACPSLQRFSFHPLQCS